MTLTIAELLRAAQETLAATSTTPRLDAELLLAHILGWSRARLLAERTYTPDDAQRASFVALVERRSYGEPVAYIVGHKEFFGLDFFVDRRVLVPRPETELLVELAITLGQDEKRKIKNIVDIGTGSGAIVVALATGLPQAQMIAIDISADALAVAARNVERHDLSERITLLQGDLLAPLPGLVDMIVSNPPYTILEEVEPNVHAHEPHLALAGGIDGADLYRRMFSQAPAYLKPGGAMLVEIGAWQGPIVTDLARDAFPQASIELHKDLAGHDRVVVVDTL